MINITYNYIFNNRTLLLWINSWKYIYILHNLELISKLNNFIDTALIVKFVGVY